MERELRRSNRQSQRRSASRLVLRNLSFSSSHGPTLRFIINGHIGQLQGALPFFGGTFPSPPFIRPLHSGRDTSNEGDAPQLDGACGSLSLPSPVWEGIGAARLTHWPIFLSVVSPSLRLVAPCGSHGKYLQHFGLLPLLSC